ncbi:hypothetical protein M3Y96_00229600 [Aphelenchoides besseyi]|nr:hypothetical protein M3Y96_00229600 [Aphelenchoides besseyi]
MDLKDVEAFLDSRKTKSFMNKILKSSQKLIPTVKPVKHGYVYVIINLRDLANAKKLDNVQQRFTEMVKSIVYYGTTLQTSPNPRACHHMSSEKFNSREHGMMIVKSQTDDFGFLLNFGPSNQNFS